MIKLQSNAFLGELWINPKAVAAISVEHIAPRLKQTRIDLIGGASYTVVETPDEIFRAHQYSWPEP